MRLACAMLLLFTGCATYEFDLTQPPDLQRHIGKNIDQVVTRDSLEYRLRAVDNRLVMRIFNQSEKSIQLRGDKSVIVDPGGQSRALRSLSIAPHSFAKLIFPPIRPRIYDPGPTFGIGVHGGISRHYHRDPFYPSAYDYPSSPRYLYVDDDTQYWDWNGEGEIRINLVYKIGEDGGASDAKEIRHDFTFRRRKM